MGPHYQSHMGALDFCPRIRWFVVPTLTHTQLTNLFQAGAWGDIEKPWHDIAFLMIVPSTNIGGEQIFGLAVVWAHPCKGCLTTLEEAACRLALLMAFICMSSTTHHVPLSDAGHLGTMTDGILSVNTCSHLHQLQTWKLLQHGVPLLTTEWSSPSQGWPIQHTTRGDLVTKRNECILGVATDHETHPGFSLKGARVGS